MNEIRAQLSQIWQSIQGTLFPWLCEELGELTEKQQQLVTVLEVARLEEHIPSFGRFPGRPLEDRIALARAFVAKAVYHMPTTRALRDRLASDVKLRRLCGWERRAEVPSESTFSRAFAEFAESRLPERVHQAIIESHYAAQLVGHLARDSTAIEAREKPAQKGAAEEQPEEQPVKRGRRRKGEQRPTEPTRLERQAAGMSLAQMLEELPKACDVGTKKNSKGYKESWIGYKLHLDVADGGIPISALLSSASLHDSQAAIPLAAMSQQRVINLYDLMDSAYDAAPIKQYSQQLGHVPIIDTNPRRDKALKDELALEAQRRRRAGYQTAEELRYHERSTAERVNSRLKDDFGGRLVRVRGHLKVMSHLMFGIVALTVDQLMKWVE